MYFLQHVKGLGGKEKNKKREREKKKEDEDGGYRQHAFIAQNEITPRVRARA